MDKRENKGSAIKDETKQYTPIEIAKNLLGILDSNAKAVGDGLLEWAGTRSGFVEAIKGIFGEDVAKSLESATGKDIALLTIIWQIMNAQRRIVESLISIGECLETQAKTLNETMEKRDQKITEILSKINDWMKYYQPTLDEAKNEYDQLRKVQGNDRNHR